MEKRVSLKKDWRESLMKNRYVILGLLVMTLWVSGCAVIGRGKDFRSFDEKVLAQVTPGQTSAAEANQHPKSDGGGE